MSSQDALDINQTTPLSDVTLTALQLIQQPFGAAVSETETFSDDTSLEQLADVKQALVGGDDLLLILGETGAGKSVLLNQLGTNSGQNIQCFAVKGSPRFSTLNLFAGMLEAFKLKPSETLKDILDELTPCLQTMVARNTLSAIVLDDADQISETELTQLLSSMLYINSQEDTLMRVALAAPPEFEDRIPDLLPEGADLPYSSLVIEGMNSERAAEYLAMRLQQAGYTGELPFSDTDIDDIVSQSRGLPGGVQAAAASLLNQQYDPNMHPPIEELQSVPSQPLLQSRNAKFALGALATLLIVGGLLMFMSDGNDEDTRYADNSSDTEDSGTNPLQTESLNTTSLSALGDDDTTSQDVESDEAEEGSSGLRIVEERTVTPFTSEAIESLVPEITQTTRNDTEVSTTSDADTASDVDTNTSVASDPDTRTTTISSVNEPDTSSVETAVTESLNTASDSPDSSSLSDELPDDSLDANLSDSDLLPDADIEALDDSVVAATEDAIDSPSADTGTSANTPVPVQVEEQAAAPSGNSDILDVDPELVDILESPTWILVQDSSKITVQMSASRDRPSIESFLKRNRSVLPAPNSIYTFQRRGETWFALLHGLYSTFEEAQAAVEQMPDSAVTDQPWIRNVGRVQDVLKAQ